MGGNNREEGIGDTMNLGEFREQTAKMPDDAELFVYVFASDHEYKRVCELDRLVIAVQDNAVQFQVSPIAPPKSP